MSVRGLKEPIVPGSSRDVKGAALKWLHTLPFGSIHNFEDWPRPLSCTSRLANGNQNPKILSPKSRMAESAPKLLDRFNHAVLQERAKNLNDFISRSKKYLDVERMRMANNPNSRRDQDRTSSRGRDFSTTGIGIPEKGMKARAELGRHTKPGSVQKNELDRDDLKPCKTTLIGFNGEQSRQKGFIDLRFTLGVKDAFKSERVRFIVAEFVSPYNIILGRPTIHKWDMLVSTKHQKLKVIGNQGTVVTVNRGSKRISTVLF
ncbi:hypothetical protein K1719_021685 [Acacia pycnantha]|nr:hypothetical protein K1719_021685 [Acacia pycnantha]